LPKGGFGAGLSGLNAKLPKGGFGAGLSGLNAKLPNGGFGAGLSGLNAKLPNGGFGAGLSGLDANTVAAEIAKAATKAAVRTVNERDFMGYNSLKRKLCTRRVPQKV
jgi:hypothetical protein